MPDEDPLPLSEAEIDGIHLSLFALMELLKQLDDKGVSARAFTTALIYCLQSSFEAMNMERKAVKDVLQHIINTYENEEQSE